MTAEDVQLRWPRDSGRSVECPQGLYTGIESLRVIKTRITELEAEKEGIEAQIKLTLGDATTLTLDGKPVATWKAQDRSTLDTKALRQAHPQLAESFTRTNPHRVLLLKK
jgi:predicted phage-related endonuclease